MCSRAAPGDAAGLLSPLSRQEPTDDTILAILQQIERELLPNGDSDEHDLIALKWDAVGRITNAHQLLAVLYDLASVPGRPATVVDAKVLSYFRHHVAQAQKIPTLRRTSLHW